MVAERKIRRMTTDTVVSTSSIASGETEVARGTSYASCEVLLGDSVRVGSSTTSKNIGRVRFVGETKFAAGLWVGVELQEKNGKNDGSVQGTRYFSCDDRCGLFLRPSNLHVLREADMAKPLAPVAEERRRSAAVVVEQGAGEAVKKEPSERRFKPRKSTRTVRRELAEAMEEHDSRQLLESIQRGTELQLPQKELDHARTVLDYCQAERAKERDQFIDGFSEFENLIDDLQGSVRAMEAQVQTVCGTILPQVMEDIKTQVREVVGDAVERQLRTATCEISSAVSKLRQLSGPAVSCGDILEHEGSRTSSASTVASRVGPRAMQVSKRSPTTHVAFNEDSRDHKRRSTVPIDTILPGSKKEVVNSNEVVLECLHSIKASHARMAEARYRARLHLAASRIQALYRGRKSRLRFSVESEGRHSFASIVLEARAAGGSFRGNRGLDKTLESPQAPPETIAEEAEEQGSR
eukprot:TRINITY_DN73388_c0_g1_i1.p1 TRINITY_DN73388_c0_g1~~TRINITY_DN73388_c0_g1_i1.p1  ORF type:complete len:466 (+),score=72.45 TRINITY_DN73388_c0_g1_i1:74-1471(+)